MSRFADILAELKASLPAGPATSPVAPAPCAAPPERSRVTVTASQSSPQALTPARNSAPSPAARGASRLPATPATAHLLARASSPFAPALGTPSPSSVATLPPSTFHPQPVSHGALALALAPDQSLAQVSPEHQAATDLIEYFGRDRLQPPAPTSLADLPDDQRARCREIERFLREVIELTPRCGSQGQAVDYIYHHHHGDYPILAQGRRNTLLNIYNARRWTRILTDHRGKLDWDRLVDCAQNYAQGVRCMPGDPEFWHLLFRTWLKESKPKITVAYAAARQKYLKLHQGITPAGAIPSVHICRRWINRLPQAEVALATKGITYFHNRHLNKVARDWSKTPVNHTWFGDGHVSDILCSAPGPNGTRFVCRPCLAAWYDARSGYLVSFVVSPVAINHLPILLSLYDGIARAGSPPAVLYCDWGADYRKQGLFEPLNLAGRDYSVSAALGITFHKARAHNPAEKIIERFFRELCAYWAQTQGTYIGNSPGNRPESAEVLYNQIERLPTIESIEAGLRQAIAEYHARPRPGAATDARSPAEAWATREIPVYTEQQAEDLHRACHFPYGTAKVSRGHGVRCTHPYIKREGAIARDHEYYPETPEDQAKIHPWADRELVVKIYPTRDDRIAVYRPDTGAYLATLAPRALVQPYGESEAIVAHRREQNRILGTCRDAIAALTTPQSPDAIALVRSEEIPAPNPRRRAALLGTGAPPSAPSAATLRSGLGREVEPAAVRELEALINAERAALATPSPSSVPADGAALITTTAAPGEATLRSGESREVEPDPTSDDLAALAALLATQTPDRE